jgi:AcrR family transcriptional regulator
MENREKIKKGYIEYLLENDRQPASVYLLAKQLGISDADFYQAFNSLNAVEEAIWKDFFDEARLKTESQETYVQYSVREKLLSFYYIWIEVLKTNRSFVEYRVTRNYPHAYTLPNTSLFRQAFKEYINELLREGRTTTEVVHRPFLIERYADGFWQQALYILNFWVKDVSQNFEQTDALIEKSVNTSFDLVGRTPVDSLFDYFKFVYQNNRRV